MTPRGAAHAGNPGQTPRELPVLLGAVADAPETLLLIGVPGDDGVVHVRVWSASDWSAPPRGRAERATALLQWLEEQSAAGRSLNQSLYALRLWLRREGNQTR
ncbi:MAG TPA: hypothetical protein VKA54_01655 [Gemmatimonadaceae bacterium]|nr:hypothetical protein [Gemmatimonadaceae bacterium]